MNCRVSGGLPNAPIDPGPPARPGCVPASVLLFGQSVNVPITVVYGANGDENSQRVRLDATLAQSTQSGQLAKASGAGCTATVGPAVPLSTSFAGKHIALIDKSQTPACVFESRLDLSSYSQTIGQGLALPVGFATQSSVQGLLEARLDFELAKAVNGLLQPSANVSESGFVSRSGRCQNDYRRFAGS